MPGSTHVLSLALHTVNQRVQRPLGRIGAAELRVEVGLVLRNFCQGVVDLVVQAHLLGGVDVLQRDTGFLAERHLPVAVEALPGFTQTASEESCAYSLYALQKKSPTGHSTEGSFSSSQYILRMEKRQFPVGVIQICWMGSRTLDLRNRDCLSRFHDDEGVYLPTLAQVLGRMVGVGHIALILVPDRIGHAALAFSPVKFSG